MLTTTVSFDDRLKQLRVEYGAGRADAQRALTGGVPVVRKHRAGDSPADIAAYQLGGFHARRDHPKVEVQRPRPRMRMSFRVLRRAAALDRERARILRRMLQRQAQG